MMKITEAQKVKVLEVLHQCFVDLRSLTGVQSQDLAYAVHNIPLEIIDGEHFNPEVVINRLSYYQRKHKSNLGYNYVDEVTKIFTPQ